MPSYSQTDLYDIAKASLNTTTSCIKYLLRKMRALYGVSFLVFKIIWCMMEDTGILPEKSTPHHLLWTLCFLKSYSTEDTLATLLGTSRNTLRKWVWTFIPAISKLEVVSFGTVLVRITRTTTYLSILTYCFYYNEV